MPDLREPAPEHVVAELTAVARALDETVPAKSMDRNLLVATWNLRAFGGLTEKWEAGEKDSPKRDLSDLAVIAEIVSRFDVVALQEVRGNLKALRHTLKALGPHWGLVLTDVTRGSEGNDERLGFVFDTRRVQASGLAGELVVPVETDPAHIKPGAFNRQFARTPYAVSFRSSGITFTLVTLHVLWGKQPADRLGELTAIGQWLADWARQVDDWHQNLIALGDFNIDRQDDPLYQALTSTGLRPPAELNAIPRTIFDDPGKEHFYDQICWFTGEMGAPALSMDYTGRAGTFDFPKHVHAGMPARDLSWRVSDHYPLWVEFSVRQRA